MIEEYQRHNLFWNSLDQFKKEDPHLSNLSELKWVHPLDWWKDQDWLKGGIYILTGGRQIGKSTSTKLLIQNLIQRKKLVANSIFYLPCDQIWNAQQLSRTLRFFLEGQVKKSFLLVIDEVTFVSEWDRVIKGLADEGWFRQGSCLLTGSDSAILKEASMQFPGRRGTSDIVDFHLFPLSFYEYVKLIEKTVLTEPEKKINQLFDLFSSYLQTGGFLRAINDFHSEGKIKPATYATFEQWIQGDFFKRGKNLETLLVILKSLAEVGVSRLSYSSLTERIGSISKPTLLEYCQLLERLDVLRVLQDFDLNKQIGSPNKARKFHFADPFIQATIELWLERERMIQKKSLESVYVESSLVEQYARFAPVYYLKNKGEIDLLVSHGRRFLPIEVKWSSQIKPHDLSELRKYKNSIILTKSPAESTYEEIKQIPLPLFLIKYHSMEQLITLF